jgi:hypothetical protein
MPRPAAAGRRQSASHPVAWGYESYVEPVEALEPGRNWWFLTGQNRSWSGQHKEFKRQNVSFMWF